MNYKNILVKKREKKKKQHINEKRKRK